MCDPQTAGVMMTDCGPCARRVRHGKPLLRLFDRVTSIQKKGIIYLA